MDGIASAIITCIPGLAMVNGYVADREGWGWWAIPTLVMCLITVIAAADPPKPR